jgi:molybdate-binding protein
VALLANITDQAQLAALADENRRRILRLLMAGPATLTHLAAALGTYPARVRHHVKALESVGLVRLVREVTTRNYTEKFYEATASAYSANYLLVADKGAEHPFVILHCDPVVDDLALLAEGPTHPNAYSTVTVGSLDGLVALRQGLADVAGCHLLDSDSGEYNLPFVKHLFVGRPMAVVTLAHREQGLIVLPGNPKGLKDLPDLTQPGVRFVNREPGSGTRTWLDGRLLALGVGHENIEGWSTEVRTHASVAHAVASGSADAGIAPRSVALEAQLEFVPLFAERYDLVTDRSRIDEEPVARLMDALSGRTFRRTADAGKGYDTSHTGDLMVTP